MKRPVLWKLSLRTTPAAEEAVAHFLAKAFCQSAVSYADFESGHTIVSVYLMRRPVWGRAQRAKLTAMLQQKLVSGSYVGPQRFALEKVRWKNWAESWKRHFKPIEIGSALLIRPSWSKRRARKCQATVILDPGLSFGTGQHPTTAFCLEQLFARRARGQPQSLLDLGTGSGILAIAGAKLGYAPIHAIDCDAEVIRITKGNARRNRVFQKVRFLRQDVAKLSLRPSRKYSLVCANLTLPLLLAQRQRILAQLDGDGILIVAGILKAEFRELWKAYEAEGLRMLASRSEKEWRSGVFAWKKEA
jgi:ribosomal protein L11 methyltransferase